MRRQHSLRLCGRLRTCRYYTTPALSTLDESYWTVLRRVGNYHDEVRICKNSVHLRLLPSMVLPTSHGSGVGATRLHYGRRVRPAAVDPPPILSSMERSTRPWEHEAEIAP